MSIHREPSGPSGRLKSSSKGDFTQGVSMISGPSPPVPPAPPAPGPAPPLPGPGSPPAPLAPLPSPPSPPLPPEEVALLVPAPAPEADDALLGEDAPDEPTEPGPDDVPLEVTPPPCSRLSSERSEHAVDPSASQVATAIQPGERRGVANGTANQRITR